MHAIGFLFGKDGYPVPPATRRRFPMLESPEAPGAFAKPSLQEGQLPSGPLHTFSQPMAFTEHNFNGGGRGRTTWSSPKSLNGFFCRVESPWCPPETGGGVGGLSSRPALPTAIKKAWRREGRKRGGGPFLVQNRGKYKGNEFLWLGMKGLASLTSSMP